MIQGRRQSILNKKKFAIGSASILIVLVASFFIFYQIKMNGPVILMYHHLAPAGTYQDSLDVNNHAILNVENFEEQMAWLSANGYHGMFVSELQEYLTSGTHIPKKTVLLTFDDGYESGYVYALPILKKYQMKANFSVVVRDSQRRQDKRDDTAYRPDSLRHMTFDEMREMVASGLVEIGSHSFNSHGNVNVDDTGKTAPALINLHYNTKTSHLETKAEYTSRVTEDLKMSQTVLCRELGSEPGYFAYPYGAFTEDLVKIVKNAGFQAALTVKNGRVTMARQLFTLPRYNVANDMTLEEYAKLVKW